MIVNKSFLLEPLMSPKDSDCKGPFGFSKYELTSFSMRTGIAISPHVPPTGGIGISPNRLEYRTSIGRT